MTPKRIQLRRTKGWRKPEGVVVVARPSKWGNPWRVGDVIGTDIDGDYSAGAVITPELAVALYRAALESPPLHRNIICGLDVTVCRDADYQDVGHMCGRGHERAVRLPSLVTQPPFVLGCFRQPRGDQCRGEAGDDRRRDSQRELHAGTVRR